MPTAQEWADQLTGAYQELTGLAAVFAHVDVGEHSVVLVVPSGVPAHVVLAVLDREGDRAAVTVDLATVVQLRDALAAYLDGES